MPSCDLESGVAQRFFDDWLAPIDDLASVVLRLQQGQTVRLAKGAALGRDQTAVLDVAGHAHRQRRPDPKAKIVGPAVWGMARVEKARLVEGGHSGAHLPLALHAVAAPRLQATHGEG